MPASHTLAALLTILTLLAPRALPAQTFKVSRYNIGGAGGTDYLVAEPGTGRVFVTRTTHVMVVDGATGKLLGDIRDTVGVHGVVLVPKWNHGFTTNRDDGTLTMFNLKTAEPIRKIAIPNAILDGIFYDEASDRIILSNHGRSRGSAMAVNPGTGELLATAAVEDASPEGVISDGAGRLYINNRGTSTLQVIDESTMKVKASWPLRPCQGPTGLAYDRSANRLMVGCSHTSVVVDPAGGKVVATIANGDGVDALGWDPGEKLIYLPNGRDGTVTIAHQESPDKYRVVSTVRTMPGAKTISVDPVTHVAYLFQPVYGPVTGPVVGAYLLAIRH